MLWNNILMSAYLMATIFTTTCISGQQQFYRKPWPTYSLQNMPQTQFTCHDKILGGYYADAETQCQMFHVCVKVAGVGVQDFRFLCPNGTAFDQEAQICADWGDVDCESSVLYYGSDNFDLYRIGSGFESKRAPLAEEEEATFHLQRAETADVRRSKETRVDQKSRPDQPPNYTKQFEAATARNLHANHKYTNLNSQTIQRGKSSYDPVKKQPIVNYYTPTTSTTTSTTTTTTTDRSNSIDESRQEFDDIFKGSHSSHFFSNRNGGREDDAQDYNVKPREKSYAQTKKPETTTTTARPSNTQSTRSRRVQQGGSSSTHGTTTIPTTRTPPTSKKPSLYTSFNNDVFTTAPQNYKPTTIATSTSTTTPTTSTTKAPGANGKRLYQNSDPYLTQERIEPTTYNPANSIYHQKTTATPKYNELQRSPAVPKQNLEKSPPKTHSKPTATARKIQKLERTEPQKQKQKLGPRNSTFVNQNEFTEFTKIRTEQPKPFQPVQTFRAPPVSSKSKDQTQEPQYFRTRAQKVQQARVGSQDPAPFSAPLKQRSNEAIATKPKKPIATTPELSPRGFSSRGSISYKATTERSDLELFTPTTTQQSIKKFSTLVPRDVYTPTTYKPTSKKNPTINSDFNNYQTQQNVKHANRLQKQQQHQQQQQHTTTPEPTTANPYNNPNEDDGQYHPELYEVDFPRNRLNLQRSSTSKLATTPAFTTTTKKPYASNHRFDSPIIHLKTQQQSSFQKEKEQAKPSSSDDDLSDEDELFKTAHSLNFGAASINKLRADIIKAEKTSQQYNSQYSPNLVQSSSPKVTTPPPPSSTAAPSSFTKQYTFPTTHLSTSSSTTTQLFTTSTTTSTTTTRRPFTYPTTTPKSFFETKPTKSSKSVKNKSKKASSKTASSKRPPHADEDTSYDYAYYDTDTLSESPQEYPEYDIPEFTKTRKN